MAKKRRNGEGTWGEKTIKGTKYKFFRDSDGKYTYGKTEAEIKEKIIKKASSSKFISNGEDITFGEYILNWLKGLESSIEKTTYISYEDAILTRLINYTDYDLANVNISSLNDKMFQDYLNSLTKKYSINSIQKTWSLIKRCITYGEIKGDIPSQHLKDLVKTPSEASITNKDNKKKNIAVPTVDEMEFIYTECIRKDKNGNSWYGNASYVIILIMYTGLRVSEALALKWSNVNFEKNEIYITSSLARIREIDNNGKYHYSHIIKNTKSNKGNRTIPLPDRAKEALLYFENIKNSIDSFVCIDGKGEHYKNRSIERTLERIVSNSKCLNRKYSPHSLRHGYGSVLLSKGVDIKIVSELLGHEDVAFTYNVYIKIFETDKHDAVSKLNNIKKEASNETKNTKNRKKNSNM